MGFNHGKSPSDSGERSFLPCHSQHRSRSDANLKSSILTCHNQRSRRLWKRRLYRLVLFIVIAMFVAFQLSTTSQLDPWLEKSSLTFPPNHSASLRESNDASQVAGALEDRAEDSENSEGFFDKLEYGIIKFFMSKLIAAHMRRQKAAEVLMNQEKMPTTVPTEEEKRIQRKPLAKIIETDYRNEEGFDYKNIGNSTSTITLEDVQQKLHENINTTNHLPEATKTIVLYTRFFGRRNWTGIFGNSTDFEAHQCPVTNCVFTNDRKRASTADALIFHDRDFRPKAIPKVRKPHQRYIWLFHEAPGMENPSLNQVPHGFFNWTYTYHRDSDILLLYGGLQPLRGENSNPTRPGLLNPSGDTYQEYISALDQANTTFDTIPGRSLVKKGPSVNVTQSGIELPKDERKLIAWMVSHCTTWSGRELYVQDLMQYVDVDIYGKCGPLSCGKTHHDSYCYSNVLAANYKFYLSFENSMCNDYITEKVWYPLHYGLVPIVYGGARYEDYLPPHSYIDATNMSPSQLATLLIKLGSNPRLYNQYHIWRRYWRVIVPPPMCELCQRLHEDHEPRTVDNPHEWWKKVNNCTTKYSFEEYPRQDLRLIVSKVDVGVKLFRKMIASFF